MEHLTLNTCPLCGHQELKQFLTVKDHMITQEVFELQNCESCGFVFTNPRPTEDHIGHYYKSDVYVSHSSSKKGLINWVYNVVRNYTLRKKVRLVSGLVQGRSLLDIGAGTGHFLNAVKEAGFNVQGFEPDADARTFARKNFGVELRKLEEITEVKPSSVDLISMWHVLEHVYHLQRDFKHLVNCLNTGGVLLIAVPNHESADAKHYGAGWAAYDVPRHLYHFREKDIALLAQQHGLKLEKVLPMNFDSYYVSMLSEKYKGGSILRAFINGWRSNLKKKTNGASSQIYILRKFG